ncbi:hypothetical protein IE81DRAFT_349217 [Ceraceosorus guamensis]|uniref:Uncharacterized protein n=1 Tax=Ceraceosorus guamensis TaxID=1522189 RepID=A0A316VS59_9BASI|nr:hypothetical protein IE81DRAFT_349217 [Ceraceosorus guamensis]PWN40479.1 hypothetical protein IE81DRAFT_349217 [Ceraceosorus guamensis]
MLKRSIVSISILLMLASAVTSTRVTWAQPKAGCNLLNTPFDDEAARKDWVGACSDIYKGVFGFNPQGGKTADVYCFDATKRQANGKAVDYVSGVADYLCWPTI